MRKTDNNFIMLPTVDFCFKELMQNPKVRKGFIAALRGIPPEEIKETSLMPTILSRDSEDDRLGILDVRIRMQDGTQIDMEMQMTHFAYWDHRVLFYLSKMFTEQLKKGEPYENLQKCIHVSILDFIYFPDDDECYRSIIFCDRKTGKPYTELMEIQILELKKLKGADSSEELIKWMRFFSGKSREEFEQMAGENEYLDEAYDVLKRLSADDLKRLEYEAREKALRDYNSQMGSAFKSGKAEGIEFGRQLELENGIQKLLRTCKKFNISRDMAAENLKQEYSLSDEKVQEYLSKYWK